MQYNKGLRAEVLTRRRGAKEEMQTGLCDILWFIFRQGEEEEEEEKKILVWIESQSRHFVRVSRVDCEQLEPNRRAAPRARLND